MSDGTGIEWTDATWNPITGCSVVSAGCKHCYAMKLAGTRLKHHPSRAGLTIDTKAGPVWNGQVRFNEQWLEQPLRWKRPRMIFVCAHGDLFHEAVPDEWIGRVFAIMAQCPQHTFQVLTKRIDRARVWINDLERMLELKVGKEWPHWPLRNVWLGTSVEDQDAVDVRLEHLCETRAALRFVSAEPLLGPIDIRPYLSRKGLFGHDPMGGVEWVIVGGESGEGARPMHPAWAWSLLEQCRMARVAFFFKQWGAFRPEGIEDIALGLDVKNVAVPIVGFVDAPMIHCGKKAAGAVLRGHEYKEMPRV